MIHTMSRPVGLTATPSQTVGPFFHHGLADNVMLGCLVRPDTKGERVRLRIRVLDGEGVPVDDALVELWQADADGQYVRPDNPSTLLSAPGFCGFGRLATSADGVCTFDTIRPGRIALADGQLQASHINACLFARGLLRQLYTRVYFENDPDLAADAVLRLVPAERRQTLIARAAGGSEWRFDICLQGEHETVFFDL
jgi:protocatechuate 3,4-dioxygenase, alpha subunit